jgi:tetratricopeptide (TPR) repeat protein
VIFQFTKLYLSLLLLLSSTLFAGNIVESSKEIPFYTEKVVVGYNYISDRRFVSVHDLYTEGWDELAQTVFWRKVIRLHHDSAIINIARLREPVFTISTEQWGCQTEPEKDDYKLSVCRDLGIDDEEMLYVTSGKKFFFEYKKVLPLISKSIKIFEEQNTDPWYAQAILVIESPGKTNARSYAGAKGAFQLMPSVARKYGLTVTRYHDDRDDIKKSAKASAALLSSVCIPKAKELLDDLCINYNETDVWFRLIVLHIYHAGYSNLSCAVRKIAPVAGGMELIQSLWQTECKGFKNQSQNYSQIALASLLEFDSIINVHTDTVFMVSGDRLQATTNTSKLNAQELHEFYSALLTAYDDDLINGVIPVTYFMSQSNAIEQKLAVMQSISESDSFDASDAESADRLYELGNELIRKHKFEDAIVILKAGIEKEPSASHVYDSIGKAYELMGDTEMAIKYNEESEKLLNSR